MDQAPIRIKCICQLICMKYLEQSKALVVHWIPFVDGIVVEKNKSGWIAAIVHAIEILKKRGIGFKRLKNRPGMKVQFIFKNIFLIPGKHINPCICNMIKHVL